MVETCKIRDTLVSNSGIAKSMPGRAQTLPNACCALPPTKRSRYSNRSRTVKYSIKAVSNYVNYTVTPTLLYYHWHNRIKKKNCWCYENKIRIMSKIFGKLGKE